MLVDILTDVMRSAVWPFAEGKRMLFTVERQELSNLIKISAQILAKLQHLLICAPGQNDGNELEENNGEDDEFGYAINDDKK